MLIGFFALLLCQLLGEAMAHGAGLPVPGPVIGIVLMIGALAVRARWTGRDVAAPDAPVSLAADGLLRHLGLLFVPAGAGIVQSLPMMLSHGVAVVVALVGSTLLTLVATVAVFRLVSRATEGRRT